MSFSFTVNAQATDFEITRVEVNDLVLDSDTILDLERGERIDVEVFLLGLADTDDVSISAKIMGYEYGSVTDETALFSIETNHTFKKKLTLYVPDDIDASEKYTLRIEASDKTAETTREFTIHIDESRHDLKIFDVLLNPSSTITAGHPVYVTVRLENLGEKEQNDIRVKASIPSLGISTVNYLDELNTEEQEDDDDNQFRQDNSKQIDLLLRIPTDAATGVYDLVVDVEYNRGHNFLTQTLNLNVEGGVEETGVQTVLNSDSNSKATDVGETVEYRVMIANLGDEPGIYTVQVDGISTWGEASVQPSFLTVLPDSTGELVISVTPFDTDESATHTWVARISLGTEVLNEMLFTTKVDAPEVEQVVAQSNDALKSVLAVIFGVLVVVLVILALIIAFKKVREDEEEDTTSLENQTYYQYYPRK
jgi:hypothetical protein